MWFVEYAQKALGGLGYRCCLNAPRFQVMLVRVGGQTDTYRWCDEHTHYVYDLIRSTPDVVVVDSIAGRQKVGMGRW